MTRIAVTQELLHIHAVRDNTPPLSNQTSEKATQLPQTMNSSEDDDNSASSRSPSPALSLEQEPEEQDPAPPTLDGLVLHFVSAKRSLASTTHVYRANELVTHARLLVEEIALLNAKNAFARRALSEQIETLNAARDTIIDEDERIASDFEEKVLKLDAAHERLSKTLDGLRSTIVASQTSSPGQEDVEGKTLHDFIEVEKHESLITSIRKCIDSYHERRGKDAQTPLEDFTSRLNALTTALPSSKAQSETADDSLRMKPTIVYSPKSSGLPDDTPTLFNTLTDHAQTLATLLSQLVKHYDLCVSALKHTEGGGEAARLALDDGQIAADDSLYAARYEPMDQEEREIMLRVLVGDAEEVEDVISEMAELGQAMEESHDELVVRAERCRSEYRSLQQIHQGLKTLRTGKLPLLLQMATNFYRTFYSELEESLRDDTSALLDLVQFYEQFQRGYGALRKEVRRRETMHERAVAVAEKAQRELNRLFEQDEEAREAFMEDVGDFIPRELGMRFGMDEKGIRFVVGEED